MHGTVGNIVDSSPEPEDDNTTNSSKKTGVMSVKTRLIAVFIVKEKNIQLCLDRQPKSYFQHERSTFQKNVVFLLSSCPKRRLRTGLLILSTTTIAVVINIEHTIGQLLI